MIEYLDQFAFRKRAFVNRSLSSLESSSQILLNFFSNVSRSPERRKKSSAKIEHELELNLTQRKSSRLTLSKETQTWMKSWRCLRVTDFEFLYFWRCWLEMLIMFELTYRHITTGLKRLIKALKDIKHPQLWMQRPIGELSLCLLRVFFTYVESSLVFTFRRLSSSVFKNYLEIVESRPRSSANTIFVSIGVSWRSNLTLLRWSNSWVSKIAQEMNAHVFVLASARCIK